MSYQLEVNKICETLTILKEDIEDLLIEESSKSEDKQSEDVVDALNSALYDLDEAITKLESTND